jgi:hypothetical protein
MQKSIDRIARIPINVAICGAFSPPPVVAVGAGGTLLGFPSCMAILSTEDAPGNHVCYFGHK